MKLTAKQKALVDAIASFKSSSRGVVVAFEGIISDYVTSFACHELDFILVALERQPRLKSAAKIIIKETLPVTLASNGKYTNVEGLTKKQKASARAAVKKFIAAEYTSLLNHDKIKVQVEYNWDTRAKTFQSQAQTALDNGVDKQVLLDMIMALKPNPKKED